MIIGHNFYNHPEVLMQQLKQMSTYKKSMEYPRWARPFIKTYISLFGIPEVGVQLRAYYFFKFLDSLEDKNFKPEKIFDAGCGIGLYFKELEDRYKGSKFEGVDLEKSKISFCKAFFNHSRYKFSVADLEKFKKSKKYNLVLSIDVMEHVNNYKIVLKNLAKITDKNGYLFLHTHLIPKNWYFKSSEQWHHKEHVREGFLFQELISAIEKSGFEIIKAKKTLGLFGGLPFELYLMIIQRSLVLAGIVFPLLHLVSRFDYLIENKKGHNVAILARKI